MRPYDILGVGSACVDMVYRVDDDFLQSIGIKKGDGQRAEWDIFSSVIEKCKTRGYTPLISTGGSASNTIKGLASLGNSAAFYSKVGNDEFGAFCRKTYHKLGIKTLLTTSDLPTTQIAVFVTEDHQRTFLSFSGASSLMPEDPLTSQNFENVRLMHIEGYLLDELSIPYVEKVMTLAKSQKAIVSLDLGCPRIAKTFSAEILHLLKTAVDIVIGNANEVQELVNLPQKDGCAALAKYGPITIVLNGKDGCWVGHNNEVFSSPATKVDVIDTTGAGDLFACGFLHGYLKGYNLPDCAWLGNLLGGAAVSTLGAEIPDHKWTDLKKAIAFHFNDL